MSSVGDDWAWSDRFLPEIKHILGVHLIGKAPLEDDRCRNTDLIVLKLDAVRIGCRVRRADCLAKYADEFTIRAGRPSGVKTELTKVVEGWGDYFFYGISNATEDELACWVLGDLNAFRLWFNRCLFRDDHQWTEQGNHDGSSTFFAFKIDAPDNFVVARLEHKGA